MNDTVIPAEAGIHDSNDEYGMMNDEWLPPLSDADYSHARSHYSGVSPGGEPREARR